ncbi:hypothetical protein QBC34DRAFT_463017 [Podospora aff. communis PSN243]|uniref:RNase III domain-containing protein n=1 Tax=Podospora aff. communis PSN243 TaxID=3040156 RepID=A0AAV9GSQ0_9PEZI|nr:hypothetical protein QBC34DRAFT_463017 [Podospora aff. communis PSN243]
MDRLVCSEVEGPDAEPSSTVLKRRNVLEASAVLLSYASQHDAFRTAMPSKPIAPSATRPDTATRALLFNIGVFLLELVYGDSLENQPWRSEYISIATGEANDATDLCTALRWQKRAEEEFGYGIGDAIRRCILCAFDGDPDLASRVFIQVFWEGVVKPVEDFLAAWTRGV